MRGTALAARGLVSLAVVACSDNSTAPTTPDTITPTVSIASPAAGAVTGTVAITADASDNVRVTVVTWKVNGALLPAPDTEAPFVHDWDTSLSGPGIYEWIAIAKDKAGNTTESVSVTYTVAP